MNYIDQLDVRGLILNALREDIGNRDITSDAFIPKNKLIKAYLLAEEEALICGLEVAAKAFKLKDKRVKFKPLVRDGNAVRAGRKLALIYGPARSILAAERVALNFLSHLCGIATKTRLFVNAAKPYRVKVLDTRKTTPGLRLLEKYAVRIGGGFNHRFNLAEMILIKDNHLNVIGGLDKLSAFDTRYKVEIEVSNLKEFRQALPLEPDIVMLDNMKISDIRKAVLINRTPLNQTHRKPLLEASGGITLDNIRAVAGCGIDMVSVGSLTHSVRSINISLEIL